MLNANLIPRPPWPNILSHFLAFPTVSLKWCRCGMVTHIASTHVHMHVCPCLSVARKQYCPNAHLIMQIRLCELRGTIIFDKRFLNHFWWYAVNWWNSYSLLFFYQLKNSGGKRLLQDFCDRLIKNICMSRQLFI